MSTESLESGSLMELPLAAYEDAPAVKTVYASPMTAERIREEQGVGADDAVVVGQLEYATVADLDTDPDLDDGTLYVDPDTRSSLRLGAGDHVELEPVPGDEIEPAQQLRFHRKNGGPLAPEADDDPDAAEQEYKDAVQRYLRQRMEDAVVTEDDRLRYPDPAKQHALWMQASYTVEGFTPGDEDGVRFVRVTPETDITVDWDDTAASYEEVGDTDITYDNVGGLDDAIADLQDIVQYPLEDPDAYAAGTRAGALLTGPPGTGKTLLAKAVANEVEATFMTTTGAELYQRFFSESESAVHDLMEDARERAPTVLFIDEIEGLVPERGEAGGSSGDAIRRVVNQWCTELDGVKDREDVYILGATNRPQDIDPAFRRNGRIDKEIDIGVPDRAGREEILDIHLDGLPLADDVDTDWLADATDGYVGADIRQLRVEANTHVNRRARRDYVEDPDTDYDKASVARDGEDMQFRREDFRWALEEVTPTQEVGSDDQPPGDMFGR